MAESFDNNSSVINLTGELTIENSIPIHDFLNSKTSENNDLTIVIEKSNSIDLSIIQLIIGFINAREKTKTKTVVEFKLNNDIMELLNKSGSTSLISSMQKKKP